VLVAHVICKGHIFLRTLTFISLRHNHCFICFASVTIAWIYIQVGMIFMYWIILLCQLCKSVLMTQQSRELQFLVSLSSVRNVHQYLRSLERTVWRQSEGVGARGMSYFLSSLVMIFQVSIFSSCPRVLDWGAKDNDWMNVRNIQLRSPIDRLWADDNVCVILILWILGERP